MKASRRRAGEVSRFCPPPLPGSSGSYFVGGLRETSVALHMVVSGGKKSLALVCCRTSGTLLCNHFSHKVAPVF
jgi:hypothetical protein